MRGDALGPPIRKHGREAGGTSTQRDSEGGGGGARVAVGGGWGADLAVQCRDGAKLMAAAEELMHGDPLRSNIDCDHRRPAGDQQIPN